MPSGMKHRSNDHKPLCFNHFVDNAIRKPLWISPMDILRGMSAAMQKWIDREGIEYRQYLVDEFISETSSSSFIPLGCFKHVVFRLRTGNDLPFHGFDRDRKRRLSSASGIEVLGSAWWS